MKPTQGRKQIRYAAFLRGVNVGGANMISKDELTRLCNEAGFASVSTYLNSGNVLFEGEGNERELKTSLEKVLLAAKGKSFSVAIRNAKELHTIATHNPFPEAQASKVGVLLLSEPVGKNFMDDVAAIGTEEIVPARRELYIHYPDGMGRTKLKFRSLGEAGTVRNINTICKLAERLGD